MHTKCHRLRALGISTYLATLPWQPNLTHKGKEAVAVEILRSQHGLHRPKAQQALHEHARVQIRRLQLKGRAKWFESIPHIPHDLYPAMNTTTHDTHTQPPTNTANPATGLCPLAPPSTSAGAAGGAATTASSSSDPRRLANHLMDPATGPWQLAPPSPGASAAGPRAHPPTTPQDPPTAASTSSEARPPATGAAKSSSSNQALERALAERRNSHHHPDPSPASSSHQAPEQAPAQVVFFRCPRCPRALPAQHPSFHSSTLDKKVWCNDCRRSLPVALWQCTCHIQWHACPTHQQDPDRLRRQQTPQPKTTKQAAKPKPLAKALGRGRDAHLHQWLDQPAPKRARPNPDEIELGTLPLQQTGLKHYLLSPRLQAKFPRLGSSTSTTT